MRGKATLTSCGAGRCRRHDPRSGAGGVSSEDAAAEHDCRGRPRRVLGCRCAGLAGRCDLLRVQVPAERTRTRFVSPTWISRVVVVGLFVVVPRADWLPLEIHAPGLRILGLAIVLAATALTVWARLALGAMWSAAPTVKQEHKLRTGGPYAITRHPIYTGLLGMMLGSLLLAGGASGSCPSRFTSWYSSSRSASKSGSCWPSSLTTTRATGGTCLNWSPACASSLVEGVRTVRRDHHETFGNGVRLATARTGWGCAVAAGRARCTRRVAGAWARRCRGGRAAGRAPG